MFKDLRRLLNETAVYGLSTVAGRFLNLLLLPLYTHALAPADYGVAAILFSYLAFLNVVYGCGMDFALMRYWRERGDTASPEVFSTAFFPLGSLAAAFSALVYLGAGPLARMLGHSSIGASLWRLASVILALDALALLPFASLRMRHRPALFAAIKIVNIVLNLILSYVFLLRWGLGVKGVFWAALATSAVTVALLIPVIVAQCRPVFDAAVFKKLLRFGLPLVPAGLASAVVNVADRPILAAYTNDATVGLYQANYRLGVVMMLLVGMFDMAFKPFFIEQEAKEGSRQTLARVLTYFVVLGGAGFLAISLLAGWAVRLRVFGGKPLIHPDYWPGLGIVPIVTLGYLLYGVYINMIAPATLAHKSERVAYATAIGAVTNVVFLLILIPRWGIVGAAWATPLAYLAMAGSLYYWGRALYPVPYEHGRLLHVAAALAGVWALSGLLGLDASGAHAGLRLGLVLLFPVLLAATGFFKDDERRAFKEWLLSAASSS